MDSRNCEYVIIPNAENYGEIEGETKHFIVGALALFAFRFK